MALDLPTLDEIHDELIEAHRARLPDDDVSRNSEAWQRLRVEAGALYGVYRKIQIAEDDVFPDTAELTVLDRHGAIVGVTRKPATPAAKSDALTVTGTAASTIVVGDLLTHANGLSYQINSNETIPAGGSVVADLVAVDTGEQTKLDAGETLTFDSPPAGINAEAELADDLDEDGEDQESDGAYSARILSKISEPGMGGNANDYRTWALENTGITSAYVYPLRRGRGSVDLAVLKAGTGTTRTPSAAEIAVVLAYIDELKPAHLKSFRVLTVDDDPENVDITIDVLPGSAYAFDWDDSTPLEVDDIVAPPGGEWVAATRVLSLVAPGVPSDMKRGDRIVIKTVSGDGDGVPIEIEATADDAGSGLTALEIKLLTSPNVVPAPGDTVYAGGPLTATIRDAIIAHFNTLGPAIGLYGTGEWQDQLNPGRLESIALAVTGVRDANTVTPSSTVTPDGSTYPTDTTVDLLEPQEIIVRKE